MLFAPFATRHMHEFGTTREMLASLLARRMSSSAGGSGANFVIVWQSDEAANPPVVEALQQGVSPDAGGCRDSWLLGLTAALAAWTANAEGALEASVEFGCAAGC